MIKLDISWVNTLKSRTLSIIKFILHTKSPKST